MTDIIKEYWIYVPVIIGCASVIVNFTPNKTDDKILASVIKFLNTLAMNFNVKGIKVKEDTAIQK